MKRGMVVSAGPHVGVIEEIHNDHPFPLPVPYALIRWGEDRSLSVWDERHWGNLTILAESEEEWIAQKLGEDYL